MKRWSIILAAAGAGVWLIVSVVRDLFEAISYFVAQPHQLLHVAAIAIVGGVAALGFDRLSPRTKRQIRVLAWGATASTLTGIVFRFTFSLASSFSFADESSNGRWALLCMLLFAGIAAYLWFEFYRVLKSGVSRSPG